MSSNPSNAEETQGAEQVSGSRSRGVSRRRTRGGSGRNPTQGRGVVRARAPRWRQYRGGGSDDGDACPGRRRRTADPARAPDESPRAGYEVETAASGRRRSRSSRCGRLMRSSSTSCCPTDRDRRLPRAAAVDARAGDPALGGGRGAGEGRRLRRGCGRLRDEAIRDRRAAGPPASGTAARSAFGRAADRGRGPAHRPGEAVRHVATGSCSRSRRTSSRCFASSRRTTASCSRTCAILRAVWGPSYQTESHYLHVYVSQLRRKIEADPARPRYLLTEPGAGYRFVDPADV